MHRLVRRASWSPPASSRTAATIWAIVPPSCVATACRVRRRLRSSMRMARWIGSAGLDGRFAYALTRALSLEVGGSWSKPHVDVTVTQDSESTGTTLIAETVSQYTVDVGGLFWLFSRQGTRLRPYVLGGGGYLRQLHENQLVVETGHTIFGGGGVAIRVPRARTRPPSRCAGRGAARPPRRRDRLRRQEPQPPVDLGAWIRRFLASETQRLREASSETIRPLRSLSLCGKLVTCANHPVSRRRRASRAAAGAARCVARRRARRDCRARRAGAAAARRRCFGWSIGWCTPTPGRCWSMARALPSGTRRHCAGRLATRFRTSDSFRISRSAATSASCRGCSRGTRRESQHAWTSC